MDTTLVSFNSRFGDNYVPENIEENEVGYTYKDLEDLCEDAWQTSTTLQEQFGHPDELVSYMIQFIDWEFPSTFLANLLNFD